jgi:cytochrome P450
MPRALPRASVLENIRFNELVIVPNALQGLFRRRPGRVAVATRLNVDGRAVRLMEGLRRRHGAGPLWVRPIPSPALLMLEVDDVRRVLEGSPERFASDPETKRRGMGHFQPDALTLSRGELWRDRRRFTEAVLDTPRPAHRLGSRFVEIASEETDALLGELAPDGALLDYGGFHRTFCRIVRRVILGDSARDDEELTDQLAQLMSDANGLPSEVSDRLEPFMDRIRDYIAAADPRSLVGLFRDVDAVPDTRADGQVPHWLFALQDTLAANVLRALALIVSHPREQAIVVAEVNATENVAERIYLRACLEEAMRLWPTTPILSRETLVDLTWNGATVPAGTQVLIFNVFHHRDRERVEYADRFAPEAWTQGDAARDWAFNHFSHGPQGCPGVHLALLVGSAVLSRLLTRAEPRLLAPMLDSHRPLPHMLDYFRLRFAL